MDDTVRVAGPLRVPTVQIHPTLRCNLLCMHCYSNSGPHARAELPVAAVCQTIVDASALGYEVVSWSGGEPLLYGGLTQALACAKQAGLRTTITTNGYFLTASRVAKLSQTVDLIALSLDGPPELHNRMRGSARAFDKVVNAAKQLREAGIPFGFIHTLTGETWEHLVWLADFASQQGACLLQLHPLEFVGRAVTSMHAVLNDEASLAKAYLLCLAIARRYSGSLSIQLDLLHRDDLANRPELGYADNQPQIARSHAPPQCLSLIVVEADGSIVPISSGFSRAFRIGNIASERLAEALPRFLMDRYGVFRALCREMFEALMAPGGPVLFNWHERVVEWSRSSKMSEAQLVVGEAS